MRWASAVAEEASLEAAIEGCAGAVARDLQGDRADLLVAFVSNHFAGRYAALPGLLGRALPHRVLLGCSAAGIIGGGREVEQRPALSLTAASLPQVHIAPFRVENGSLPNLDGPPEAWERLVGVTRRDRPSFLLLADPYSFRPEAWLAGLDFAFPGSIAPKRSRSHTSIWRVTQSSPESFILCMAFLSVASVWRVRLGL